ncbi:hypothetical protein JCM9279_004339 [Rhodotorula babjevae]
MSQPGLPLPAMGSPALANPLPPPRRPSVPSTSNPYGNQQLSAHQQALLMRSQQSARAPPVASTSAPAPVMPPPPPPPTLAHDGGPAYKVPVHRSYTRARETEPGEAFPAIASVKDQERVKGWLERDAAYETELGQAKHAGRVEANALHEDLLREQDWLGYPSQPTGFRLRTKAKKHVDEAKGKRGQLRKPIPMAKSYLREIARAPETLIPIRLELEHEMYKLRDTFTWNLRETSITPEIFASHLCADMRLPPDPFVLDIAAAVTKQLADAQLSANYSDHLADGLDAAREEGRAWLEARAGRRSRAGKDRVEGGEDEEMGEVEAEDEEDKPLEVGEVPVIEAAVSDELRVAIKLDITLDSIQLVDKFEWDLSSPSSSPETFAEAFAAELGLTGEFRTAIAHSIREQVEFYTRSLCIIGYKKGGVVTEEDLRRDLLPPVPAETFRTDTADDFTPLLNQLTADEVERFDREHEREIRRKRRQTKGRGVSLPERESVRTHRTLVPRSQPGHVQYYRDERDNKHYPQPELSLPFPIVPKAVPPKPADLETNSMSPLKLLLTKDKASGAGGLAATAAANRFKKAQEGAAAAGDSPAKPRGDKKRLVVKPLPSLEELGLHEHIIDGQWFCANCGAPASVAVGRRKGPTGKDSLCGTCGKYFHRYKRQRPCAYTRDYETHLRLRVDDDVKNPKPRKRGGAAAAALAAAEMAEAAARSARTSGRGTPASQAMSPQSSGQEDDSDDDDDDEPVLPHGARRRRPAAHYGSPDTPFVQLDSDDSGRSSVEGSPPATRQRTLPPGQPSPPPLGMPTIPGPAAVTAPPPVPAPQPLPWMLAAAAELRAKQVDDRFEIIPRPRPSDPNVQEWRIRCLDCPGKLYNLGPGESLDGFLVHFKNRVHRGNVDARLLREQ